MKTSCERCAKSASCPLRDDEDQYSKCPILNADNEPLRYRNPEGYSDPTAFFALRNVMKPTVLKHKAKAEKKHHPRTQVMYNIAAEYFFGDYVGELNDVPPPAPELVEKILWKCKKYKEASVTATGAFTMEEKFEDRNDRKKAAGFHDEAREIQSPQRPEAR